jgi:hypothetical protein
MRVGALTPTMRTSAQVTSSIGISQSGVAPGTPGACITPPTALSPRTLTLRGGFTVLDQQQRGLHHHAQAQGYSGLDSYLQAGVQQQVSLTRVVSELGTTTAEEDSCWWRPPG